ncbi:hypothetical protein [Paenibacillus aquistagni]|uniref:hypothetical protein n=1 Tax=Paenibacillus aquistagni TaxID=1852522 RepID=UPI0011307F42|nr:hypothetical protein [Paenibacillus aquistagni]
MTIEVENCKRCGKVFKKAFSSFCPDCFAFIRSELTRCNEYLKNNPDSDIHELSEATEVPVKKIIRYMNEGKLYVHQHPNLTYGCYFCDHQINRGYLCRDCAAKFNLEVKNLFLEDGYEYDPDTKQIRSRQEQHKQGYSTDRYTVHGTKRI